MEGSIKIYTYKSILAEKRCAKDTDFGFVGDIEKINSEVIISFIKLKLTAVFCALTYDIRGRILNTNADSIAAELAIALSAKYRIDLIYCCAKGGVFIDLEDEGSLIINLTNKLYVDLVRKKRITDGMIPKLETAFSALLKGVNQVRIMHFQALNTYNQTIPSGTRITL